MCVTQVRVAACAALVAFVQAAGSGYCDTNSGYLAAGVVLHMDDSDTQVAEAACQVGVCRGGVDCVCACVLPPPHSLGLPSVAVKGGA